MEKSVHAMGVWAVLVVGSKRPRPGEHGPGNRIEPGSKWGQPVASDLEP
jgi:hypothetical protein